MRAVGGKSWHYYYGHMPDAPPILRRYAWVIPEFVVASRGRLHWRRGPSDRLGGRDGSSLAPFIGLVDASDRMVELFARSEGVLGLCVHGMPPWHQVGHEETGRYVCSLAGDVETGWEPIQAWRKIAQEFADLIAVARRRSVATSSAGDTAEDGAIRARARVSDALERWIRLGDVRPSVRFGPAGPTIIIAGRGLLGKLVVELVQTITVNRELATCSGCGRPFFPARRAAPGRRRYCYDCGLKAARRDASRDFRRDNAVQVRASERLRSRRRRSQFADASE
jgi:hypothetical protein